MYSGVQYYVLFHCKKRFMLFLKNNHTPILRTDYEDISRNCTVAGCEECIWWQVLEVCRCGETGIKKCAVSLESFVVDTLIALFLEWLLPSWEDHPCILLLFLSSSLLTHRSRTGGSLHPMSSTCDAAATDSGNHTWIRHVGRRRAEDCRLCSVH